MSDTDKLAAQILVALVIRGEALDSDDAIVDLAFAYADAFEKVRLERLGVGD